MVRAKKEPSKDPSYKTLKADYYPVQRHINLRSTATETDYYTLDVARCLSVQNHRLYRQGKTYSVKIDLNPGAAASSYAVFALVDTWYIQKAWQLARATYMRATAGERAVMSKQQIARWEDFRVAAGLSGSTAQLVPAPFSDGLASTADTAGEFELSQIVLADGTTSRTFTWGPAAGSALSMLSEYDKSGDTDVSPSTSSAAKPYAGTDPDVHENQMDGLQGLGDAPPYDAQNFNSRVWVRIGFLDAASPHGKLSTGYFNAPCGLIAIQPTVASTSITTQLSMTVQAGDYKGVKAMNMGV
jgi:hypothetical protein